MCKIDLVGRDIVKTATTVQVGNKRYSNTLAMPVCSSVTYMSPYSIYILC